MRKFKTEQRQNLRYVVKGTLKREEMGDCVLYDTNDKLVGWLGVGPVFPYLAYHSSVPEASIDWGLPILIRDGPFCWRWTIKTKGRHDDMPTCFPLHLVSYYLLLWRSRVLVSVFRVPKHRQSRPTFKQYAVYFWTPSNIRWHKRWERL